MKKYKLNQKSPIVYSATVDVIIPYLGESLNDSESEEILMDNLLNLRENYEVEEILHAECNLVDCVIRGRVVLSTHHIEGMINLMRILNNHEIFIDD